jgi:hypothetical protein
VREGGRPWGLGPQGRQAAIPSAAPVERWGGLGREGRARERHHSTTPADGRPLSPPSAFAPFHSPTDQWWRCWCQHVSFYEREISCAAFSSDGSKLVALGMDNKHTVGVWNWRQGSLLAEVRTQGRSLAHSTAVPCSLPDARVAGLGAQRHPRGARRVVVPARRQRGDQRRRPACGLRHLRQGPHQVLGLSRASAAGGGAAGAEREAWYRLQLAACSELQQCFWLLELRARRPPVPSAASERRAWSFPNLMPPPRSRPRSLPHTRTHSPTHSPTPPHPLPHTLPHPHTHSQTLSDAQAHTLPHAG